MASLSVAIVCKNSAPTIGRVLESVRPLIEPRGGEIVAVDSGSTDATLDLLRRAGARIIQTEWRGHVATKQLALEAAEREWVLCLDSDEPVEPDLAAAITSLLDADDPKTVAARVNRKVWYAGAFLEHAWQPEWRLRLVRRGAARWGGLDPHDKLDVLPGEVRRVVDLPGTLRHNSFATFAEHLGKQVGHARVAAASLYASGARGSVWKLTTSPLGAFLKQVVVKGAWRDGWRGWLAAASTAAGTLMKHVALIELTHMGAVQTAPLRPGDRPPSA